MMTDNSLQAKTLHTCLLVIAKEIKRICEKNEIPYFLLAGTLLGAMRHKSIIPWDDDMDIGFFREDYNRFLAACQKDLSSDFYLCSLETERSYGKPFAKIRLKDTHFPEERTPEGLSDGIFVDVFPIDRIPVNPLQRKRQKFLNQSLLFTMLVKCGYQINNKKFKMVSSLFSHFFTKKSLQVRIEREQSRYNTVEGLDYTNFCGNYVYGREIIPAECLDDGLSELEIDGVVFSTPKYPERYMSCLYGDFMRLPPENQRIFKHTSSEIDFGRWAEQFEMQTGINK